MSNIRHGSAGTVSRILWHFTGGPDWDETNKRQKPSPKAAPRAYRNLQSILQTREIRLGRYTEVIRVIVPERRRFNKQTRQPEIQHNVPVTLQSAPVCCLSDIPAPHLRYHAYRYGKFAIGFHRSAVLAHGFNPVFYTLDRAKVIQTAYKGLTELRFIDARAISDAADAIELATDDLDLEEVFHKSDLKYSVSMLEDSLLLIRDEAKSASDCLVNAEKGFKELLSFVKTFDEAEFDTIYCEREWRSLRPYSFSINDVAMVVIPKRIGKQRYFEDFATCATTKLELPRTVPVVPWEDLVEH